LPIAYLASVLAGITPHTTVYEPSAGHGALLLGSNTGKVTVNELNPNRYECVQKDETLTVQIKKGNKAETILRTEGDRIVSTTVKQKDLDQFTQLAQDMRLNILQQIDKHTR
jgi:hypothetical protein